jgi:branched-subunit amino acid ABC-type transport system permease component
VAGATILGAAIATVYVERLCFAAIRSGAAVASMVSSFAVWMQIEEAVTLVFPAAHLCLSRAHRRRRRSTSASCSSGSNMSSWRWWPAR